MNSTEIKQLVKAVEGSFAKTVKVTQEDPKEEIYKITLPFKDRKGIPFYIWAFRYPKSRRLQLSDGRSMAKAITDVGTLQLEVIQKFINSYGLSFMSDLSIMETSNRSLTQRVTLFLQCLIALDGTLRVWEQMKEK